MEVSADNAVENDGNHNATMQQHSARGRSCKRLGSQFLLEVIAALEEVAAHRYRCSAPIIFGAFAARLKSCPFKTASFLQPVKSCSFKTAHRSGPLLALLFD